VVTPCSEVVAYHRFGGPGKDGGSMVLQNFSILPRHCTASQPRRPWLKSPSL